MSVFLWFIAVAFFLPTIKLLLTPYHLFRGCCGIKASVLLWKNQNGWQKIIQTLSAFEYYTQAMRLYTLGIAVFALWITLIARLLRTQVVASPHFAFLSFYVLLIVWMRQQKKITDLRMVTLLKHSGQIHPEVFFNLYMRELTFGGVNFLLEKDVDDISPEHANFRLGVRSSLSRLKLLKAGVDTVYLAHFCLNALNCVGTEYCFAVADPVAQLWGRRLLQIAHGEFVLKGAQNLHGKTGRFLLIFNHKSSFDFVVTFFALAFIRVNDRIIRPRFILAKDHFKDNPLVYRIFGVGRTCEAIHMVFISRHNRKQSALDLNCAAQTLLQHDIDLAIYPQGTRAVGSFDRSGKRRDAGFFTTFSKRDLTSPHSHLKKGAALPCRQKTKFPLPLARWSHSSQQSSKKFVRLHLGVMRPWRETKRNLCMSCSH